MSVLSGSSRLLFEGLSSTDDLRAEKLYDLTGQIAIVTGGGTGIGLVTAVALSTNGAKVYITGRRLEVLEQAAKDGKPKSGKGEILPIQADVSTKEGIRKLKEEISKKEKWVNILVNNHGVSLPCPNIAACDQSAEGISNKMLEEDFSTWDETYRINTSSYHFLAFTFLPLLSAAQSVGNCKEPGNIVMIASLSGLTKTSQRGQFNYNSTKAATIQLSKMLSTEFMRRGLGVRVNCINPGYFPSGMTGKELPGMDPEEAKKLLRSKEKYAIPVARMGTARDYAQLMLMVVSNGYMTGSELLIDGGWMADEAF